jgi:FtsP/CotA-like multicopper oxidase with cupredoxin domain
VAESRSFTGQGKLFDIFVILAVVLAIGVVVVAGISAARGETTVAAQPDGDGAAPTVEGQAITAHVSLSEYKITGDLMVPPGHIQLAVHNDGSAEHNLIVQGIGGTDGNIQSGASETVDLGELGQGTYQLICSVAGHEASGMHAVLTVQSGAPTPTGEGTRGGEDTDWAALDQAMMDSILAFPAETEGKGNQPLEPAILEDGTKQFDLTVAITPWEVEPGRVVDAWTYNGQVPGPAIRVDVGDNVQVVVHNELPMGTDVHWHGIATPFAMDGVAPITQELIDSGEDFTYEFEARAPAIGMYHAHHHGQMQVTNGLFGTFIIGDTPIPYGQTISGVTIPEDLEISQEIPLVLNDAGVIGFSLNGKSFPATEPYVVSEGDWIAAHYYNEGLQVHPMHQHQFKQLVFAKDGVPLDHPYWADTVLVAPGERYSVLMHPDETGIWVWHCHILTHVEREEGMFGMVTALIVEEA